MFTGLIQSVGRIHRHGESLAIEGCHEFAPIALGDSISVDGVCLTVSSVMPNGFMADLSEETLTRTTLGDKSKNGGIVNIEPALRLSDRLGGHLVSGHVDGLGEVVSINSLENSWQVEIAWKNKDFRRYICDKASIAINGISLTVAGNKDEGAQFWMAVIPHTWANTSLKSLSVGELVNIEADLMAKYAESLITTNKNGFISEEKSENDISSEWLISNGW